jgi:hypothetical protein
MRAFVFAHGQSRSLASFAASASFISAALRFGYRQLAVCFVDNDCAEWRRFFARAFATVAITVASVISGGTGITVTFSSIPTNHSPDTIMQV